MSLHICVLIMLLVRKSFLDEMAKVLDRTKEIIQNNNVSGIASRSINWRRVVLSHLLCNEVSNCVFKLLRSVTGWLQFFLITCSKGMTKYIHPNCIVVVVIILVAFIILTFLTLLLRGRLATRRMH